VPKREADALAAASGFLANPFPVNSPARTADAGGASPAAKAGAAAAVRAQRAASIRANDFIKREAGRSETPKDDLDDGMFGAQTGSFAGGMELPDLFALVQGDEAV
jgi:hypothetical protein